MQAPAQPDPRQPVRSPLGAAEAGHYAQTMAANAVELAARIRPGDVVLLHDPRTAGLAAPLAQAGARVVWRELNPVVARHDGALALDGRVRIQAAEPADAYLRRLR
jgi:hypothetical protein